MAAKDGRGGARPGAGRKPIPQEDVARIRRMRECNSVRTVAKTLGYGLATVNRYDKGGK